MKKTLSLLLALMLMLGMMTSFAAFAEEKRVLTMGGDTDDTPDQLDYPYFLAVEEELNIDLQYTYYPADSLAAMLSGGELPDILVADNLVDTMIESNLALDLAPYVDEYLPNLKSEAYKSCLDLTMALNDGKLFYICPTVGPHLMNGGDYLTQRGYAVYWDYYKDIGCPPINNDEDYLNVLVEMQKAHPTNENGEPTYLFYPNKSLFSMGGFRSYFLAGIDQNIWSTDHLYDADIFTNELINNYTNMERSAYWNDMKFYNKLYNVGPFDDNIFTMSSDEATAKCEAGTYMGAYANYFPGMIIIPSPGANVYSNIQLLLGQAPTTAFFIPKDCKNLELALEYLNYIFSPDFNRLTYSGVQGKDWDYDENGVPAMKPEAVAAKAAGDAYWDEDGDGYGVRSWWSTAYNPATLHTDGYPMSLLVLPDTVKEAQTETMREFCEVFEVEFWHDAFGKVGAKDFRNSAEQIVAGIGEVPMDIQRIMATVDDIMYTAMPSLIMAADEEEFNAIRDTVLEDIEAAGEPTAWAWYVEAWEAPKNAFNEIIKTSVPALGLELYPGLE